MKVEFTNEEVHEMLNFVVDRLVALDGLDKADRAALRRWRSEQMKVGSPAVALLAEKVNADIAGVYASSQAPAIQKPDWL